MSRIGKKPIPLPSGVKYTVQGNTVLVEGPKGKVSSRFLPASSWRQGRQYASPCARTTRRLRCMA